MPNALSPRGGQVTPGALGKPDLDDFRSGFRQFLEERVRPRDGPVLLPLGRDAYVEAGRRGFYLTSYPEDVGGFNDRRYTLALLHELGDFCVPGFSFWVHSEIFCQLLLRHATAELRERYLPACLLGDCIGSIALTEAGGGSSLTSIDTVAERTSTGYVLTGRKVFISLGSIADLMIVSARMSGENAPSLYLVDAKSPGLSITNMTNTFAMRELAMADVVLEGVRVPAEHTLTRNTVVPMIQSLTLERHICAVIAHAIFRRVLQDCAEHLKRHRVAGTPLVRHQGVRFEMGKYMAQLRALDALLSEQNVRYVEGRRLLPEAAAACKLQSVDALINAASFLVRMHGARGVVGDESKLWILNDAFAQSIYGGTNEILLEIIGSSL